jgi:hypothetical protein
VCIFHFSPFAEGGSSQKKVEAVVPFEKAAAVWKHLNPFLASQFAYSFPKSL